MLGKCFHSDLLQDDILIILVTVSLSGEFIYPNNSVTQYILIYFYLCYIKHLHAVSLGIVFSLEKKEVYKAIFRILVMAFFFASNPVNTYYCIDAASCTTK